MTIEETVMKAITFDQLEKSADRLSLEKHLAIYGVPLMNPELVRAHQQKVIHKCRMLGSALEVFLVTLFRHLTHTLSLESLVRLLESHDVSNVRAIRGWTAVACVLCGTTGLFLGQTAWLLLLILPGSTITGLLFYPVPGEMSLFSIRLQSAAAYWTFERVDGLGTLPERLHARAVTALTIPGTRLLQLRLEDDPFLAVVRGFGPFRGIAYIGAWDTKDPVLDSF